MCKVRLVDINCWESCFGSEKGHTTRGNSNALYGWTVLG